jgi:quinol monooxygenase YgiN
VIIVAGTLRVPPESLQRLLPHAAEVIAATRAEPGCQVYSFAEDLLEPGLIRIFEIWDTRAHLDAHGEAAHMSPWREAVTAAGTTARDIRIYTAEGGEPL